MGQNRTTNAGLFPWFWLAAGVVCVGSFIALCRVEHDREIDRGPTEAQAEANRKRLLLVPVQTEGVMPQPVEIPEVPDPALTITIKIEKSAEFKCPHCGKLIKAKVE